VVFALLQAFIALSGILPASLLGICWRRRESAHKRRTVRFETETVFA
jgi:hypothetical protein